MQRRPDPRVVAAGPRRLRLRYDRRRRRPTGVSRAARPPSRRGGSDPDHALPRRGCAAAGPPVEATSADSDARPRLPDPGAAHARGRVRVVGLHGPPVHEQVVPDVSGSRHQTRGPRTRSARRHTAGGPRLRDATGGGWPAAGMARRPRRHHPARLLLRDGASPGDVPRAPQPRGGPGRRAPRFRGHAMTRPVKGEGLYNVVVIGGGTAGLVTAAGTAGLGGRVALIEKHRMGGDCLNTGCVPSKALIASARAAHAIGHASRWGLRDRAPEFAFEDVMERVRERRAAIAPHDSQERFESLGVDVFRGAAHFVSPREVVVDGVRLRGASFVIATGSRAAMPLVEGLADVRPYTNETIFDDLRARPDGMIILGGGPIGCELGQAFAPWKRMASPCAPRPGRDESRVRPVACAWRSPRRRGTRSWKRRRCWWRRDGSPTWRISAWTRRAWPSRRRVSPSTPTCARHSRTSMPRATSPAVRTSRTSPTTTRASWCATSSRLS
ncbi:MAG: hypothetical protein DMF77_15695 [Acidobacteria bacterium]|nr:MAG: hypothetical protein DMF77_15695 [Acidobacteriota bacterium]